MLSVVKAVLSLLLTLGLLLASLVGLHTTHQYSSAYVPTNTRLSALAYVCPILSILTYISPIGSVISMLRSGDVSEFPVEIVMAQACQNIAGAAYGIHINDNPFFLSSAVGLVFQLLWLVAWYAIFRRHHKSKWYRICHPVLTGVLGMVAILAGVYALVLAPRDVVGTLSCVLTFLLCISPLSKLGIVVRSRNSAHIPILMSAVMLIANAAWAVYGGLLQDNYVLLPSIFGFVITVFQIIVTAWCKGLLFYDLAFLQLLFGSGYTPVANDVETGHTMHEISSGTSSVTVSLDDDQRID